VGIDRCDSVYVLCGDHLLVDICPNFLLENFAFFLLCLLSLVSLYYEFSASCLGYIWCGRCCYCNDIMTPELISILGYIKLETRF
jgi:hypothetical protein